MECTKCGKLVPQEWDLNPKTLAMLGQNKVHKSWKKRFNQNFAQKTMPSDTK